MFLVDVQIFTKDSWIRLALVCVLALSGVLNLYNIDFPLGYHPDEPKKAAFVEKNIQDFKHPLLMLQLTRITVSGFDGLEREPIAVVGRIINAIAGMMIIGVIYLIAREVMSGWWSLLVALGVAVSPILVIHTHYWKEDMLFTLFALLSLWFWLQYLQHKQWFFVLLFGISLGLAFSSHYKSVLLIPLFLFLPQLRAIPKSIELRRYYGSVLLAVLLAGAVFMGVNWSLVNEFQIFVEGVKYEADHALIGHQVLHYPWLEYFSFHLVNSLLPGMTPAAALLSFSAILIALVWWPRLKWQDRILVAYVALYYIVLEASLLKPAPDYSRYVLPIVPILLYLTVRVLQLLLNEEEKLIRRIVFGVAVAVLIVWPMSDSWLLDYHLKKDTRAQVAQFLKDSDQFEMASFEFYAGERVQDADEVSHHLAVRNIDTLNEQGVGFVVTSSFQYQRYLDGQNLSGQEDELYERAQRYEELFT